MRRTSRPISPDQAARRKREQPLDETGGTITDGPIRTLDLMEILNRSARNISRGGAVSGAAQVMDSGSRTGAGPDSGIALSDGSRISFASIEDAGLMKQDGARAI